MSGRVSRWRCSSATISRWRGWTRCEPPGCWRWAKLTVVAFFAIYLVLLCIPRVRKNGGSDEALGIALAIGSIISFASMVMASKVGELAALRLHATELLLLLGAAIVVVIERPDPAPKIVQETVETAAPLGLEQAELLHNR